MIIYHDNIKLEAGLLTECAFHCVSYRLFTVEYRNNDRSLVFKLLLIKIRLSIVIGINQGSHLFDDVIYLKTEKQGVPIEVAVMYNTDYTENIHSYVNNINTIEGGTHLTGFRMALTRTLKAYADADPQISKQIEKAKIEIAGEDFREGLTAVISIKVAEPQFEGQTKTKLGNSEVAGAVQQAVGEALSNYLEEHPKEAKLICDKVVLAATARIAARKARESVQRKNPMTGGGLPGKLADCSNKDPKECEIFLVEGDSAGGSAKQGRDRHFQAILPLRGKILNVEKVQWHRVFEAESVMNIIQSIGVRFGVEGEGDREANIDELRELLGRAASKRGIFEGDLEHGELEIGQIASTIKEVKPVAQIMHELITDFHTTQSKIQTL